MSEDLKPLPCPFCGDDVARASFWFGHDPKVGDYHVFCLDCPVDGPRRDTLEEAITSWNKRASPPGGEWRWVPVEPTEEMISAGIDEWCSRNWITREEEFADIYRAMLSAAPPRLPGGEWQGIDTASQSQPVAMTSVAEGSLASEGDEPSAAAPSFRETWERKARWNDFGSPRIWLSDFNRDDEDESDVTVAYVWHHGSPDTYDAYRGGPGGWDPGSPAEVEIYAAFGATDEVTLTDAETERFTTWLRENPPEDDEPDYRDDDR